MPARKSMSDSLKKNPLEGFAKQAPSSINPEVSELDPYGPRDKKKDVKLNEFELDLITRASKKVPMTAAAFIRMAALDAAKEQMVDQY
jgi:hypothetical protein